MCGRLNVKYGSLAKHVSEAFGVEFHPQTNQDLRPTQPVSTIAANGRLHQLDTIWGIKPNWAKKILINAQAETVAEKPTFRQAFSEHRCVVPCSGWYEWSSIDGTKRKYLFENEDGSPLYMAGIYYPAEEKSELVTLTTSPTKQCENYHHRMPLLINESMVGDWLEAPTNLLATLLSNRLTQPLLITQY